MPSITLSKMAEELNMTMEQVRILRKKMGNKGVFLVIHVDMLTLPL